MEDSWKEEYKKWNPSLKQFQIKLLDDGPETLSQSWLLNQMWCEWQDMRSNKESKLTSTNHSSLKDPWD